MTGRITLFDPQEKTLHQQRNTRGAHQEAKKAAAQEVTPSGSASTAAKGKTSPPAKAKDAASSHPCKVRCIQMCVTLAPQKIHRLKCMRSLAAMPQAWSHPSHILIPPSFQTDRGCHRRRPCCLTCSKAVSVCVQGKEAAAKRKAAKEKAPIRTTQPKGLERGLPRRRRLLCRTRCPTCPTTHDSFAPDAVQVSQRS